MTSKGPQQGEGFVETTARSFLCCLDCHMNYWYALGMLPVLSKIWNRDLKLKEILLYKYSRDPGGDWHVREGGIPISTLVKV